MDKGISNIAIIHGKDLYKSMDDAAYRNFLVRKHNVKPFSSVTIDDDKNLTVSDDILEIMGRVSLNPEVSDYLDMTYDEIDAIARDSDPLEHWAELRGAFSTMDGELLRFILRMHVPLEKFIRHELAARGHDENHYWVGFEKAAKIWKK